MSLQLNDVPVLEDRSQRRLDTMLRRFDTQFPLLLFATLFGIAEWQVRHRRRVLGRTTQAVRLDSFARRHELPKRMKVTDEERTAITKFFTELRQNYARTERVARMRKVVQRCSDQLPATAIGRLFGVKGSAVLQHQRDLGVQRTQARARVLGREFLTAPSVPLVAGLSELEQRRLGQIWTEMREESGVAKREREDLLLRGLSDRLPTVYFAQKFGIDNESVSARRRELGIEVSREQSDKALRDFLRWKAVPTMPYLDAAETAELREIWQRVKKERLARKAARREKCLSELITKLKRKKKGKGPLVKCANPACKFKWPRTDVFFDRNVRGPDGLDRRCKVCEARRRFTPKLRTRASPRVIKGEERERARVIVMANAKLIPTRLLTSLLNINKNHLMFIRKEAEVEVTTADSMHLYMRWMVAEEMPETAGLETAELERLRELWRSHRAAYLDSRKEDDGKLALQIEDRRRLLASGTSLPMLSCGGPYCREKQLSWPRSSQFFRRYGRCEPEQRRCHACANRERREQVVIERRGNDGKVKS